VRRSARDGPPPRITPANHNPAHSLITAHRKRSEEMPGVSSPLQSSGGGNWGLPAAASHFGRRGLTERVRAAEFSREIGAESRSSKCARLLNASVSRSLQRAARQSSALRYSRGSGARAIATALLVRNARVFRKMWSGYNFIVPTFLNLRCYRTYEGTQSRHRCIPLRGTTIGSLCLLPTSTPAGGDVVIGDGDCNSFPQCSPKSGCKVGPYK